MTKKPNPNIVLRVPDTDKNKLEELARNLDISQTKVISLLVRGAWGALRDQESKEAKAKAKVQ